MVMLIATYYPKGKTDTLPNVYYWFISTEKL